MANDGVNWRDDHASEIDSLALSPSAHQIGEPTHQPAKTGRLLAMMSIGGIFGTLVRVEIARLLVAPSGGYPWATFVVNTFGAFLLGAILVVITEHGHGSRYLQAFLATGVCGALTTFSTLVWQADDLARTNHWSAAIIYMLTSLVGGIAAVLMGLSSARRFSHEKASA